jgi:high-affinity Fe2+/Pb2+ permease
LIDPVAKGVTAVSISVFVLASLSSAVFNDLEPSPELLRTMAGIGASFFLAYVIEATWLAQRFPHGQRSELILGGLMGLAASGLLGVIFALALSEQGAAASFGRSEDFYFWWSTVSLTGLGLLVALQPGVVHVWLEGSERKSSSSDEDD